MNFLPRLCEPCQWTADAPHGPDFRREVNRAYLSGVLANDPKPDRDRDGKPITVLLLAYLSPGLGAIGVDTTEIEVPAELKPSIHDLRAGEQVFVTGCISTRGMLAEQLFAGPPPDGVPGSPGGDR